VPLRPLLPLFVAALAVACSSAHARKETAQVSLSHDVQLPVVSGARHADLHAFLVPAMALDDGRHDSGLQACSQGADPAGALPLGYAVVTAEPGGALTVAGQEVGTVQDDGSLPDADLRGALHAPLYDQLSQVRAHASSLGAYGCRPWAATGQIQRPGPAPGRLLLALDERLPFDTVRSILYTAGQAQFGDLYLQVDDPGALRVAASTPDGQLRPAATVLQASWGYSVRVEVRGQEQTRRLMCDTQPCTPGGWPVDALRDTLVRTKLSLPHDLLIVLPEADLAHGELARTLAGLDHEPGGTPLYESKVIVGGVERGSTGGFDQDLPDVPPAAPPPRRKVRTSPWTQHDSVAAIRLTLPEIRQATVGGISGLVDGSGNRVESPLGARGTGLGSSGLGAAGEATSQQSRGRGMVGDPVILGALDRSLIDQVIHQDIDTIAACYHQALAEDESLAGKVVIKFVIAKDGSVSSSTVKRSDLGHANTESCIAQAIQRMQFAEPRGGGIVIASYPFILSADQAPAAEADLGERASVPQADPDAPQITGALDKGLIDAVIKRHLNQIRYCYQRRLVKQPGLAGELKIHFVIAKDGSVSTARVKESTLNDSAVENCIIGRFMRMRFPEPEGGGIVKVTYPFEFLAN